MDLFEGAQLFFVVSRGTKTKPTVGERRTCFLVWIACSRSHLFSGVNCFAPFYSIFIFIFGKGEGFHLGVVFCFETRPDPSQFAGFSRFLHKRPHGFVAKGFRTPDFGWLSSSIPKKGAR